MIKTLLSPLEITHLKADINYTYIYYRNGTSVLSAYTLKRFEEQLPNKFIRPNKSYLVNTDFIKKMKSTPKEYIVLRCGKQIKISRRKKGLLETNKVLKSEIQ